MHLFVNDIPIRIWAPEEKPEEGSFNTEINANREPITKAKLLHHVYVRQASLVHLNDILDHVNSKVPLNLLSLDVSVMDYEAVKNFLREKYKIVKAAGGLIKKKDRYLMIYRMKKWDLPKGKKESGEKYRQTAEREVEEECNIDVKVGKKICTTWHTYTMNRSSMLKKTRWYLMDLVDDSKMKPSLEEDIEELRWMTQKEMYHALENSYKSVRFVLQEYYKMTEKADLR
ncbi:MAG: NUDIX domain-containing protein [Cyclobacteriaceae bacterium]|nr:NUDIX domain-containing protein [Cyclobacteriaceae bacterium]